MSLPVVLRPEAQDDLLAARDWYERQRAGLGDIFVSAFDNFIARVEAMPEIYAVVLKGVRRGKLRRFPYVVYYRVMPGHIEVLAVLHGGRNQRIWQRRV